MARRATEALLAATLALSALTLATAPGGLEAISGGIAPDLRYLEPAEPGDEWFIERFHRGAVRDGKVYMPAFGETLGQEAGWAIRAWLETVPAE
jgi:mono/diheme cytochrome c family protein